MPLREIFRRPKNAPAGKVETADAHPDWPWPPSMYDRALEADLAHLLGRIQAERSELRRHGLWRVYAEKVRMRSDAQIRRMAILALTEQAH